MDICVPSLPASRVLPGIPSAVPPLPYPLTGSVPTTLTERVKGASIGSDQTKQQGLATPWIWWAVGAPRVWLRALGADRSSQANTQTGLLPGVHPHALKPLTFPPLSLPIGHRAPGEKRIAVRIVVGNVYVKSY